MLGKIQIPFKKLNIAQQEIESVISLMKTGYIGLGERVFEFEEAFAKYVGSDYAVATDSCTSALFLSLKYRLMQKRTSDDISVPIVKVPVTTVPLVADAVIEAGLEIEFTDEFDWVGSEYELKPMAIIDSAHEVTKNQMKRSVNKYRCYSFYPTKPIGSADGGMIATNSKEFADWVRSVSVYGRNQEAKYSNSWDYDVVRIGYKRHMSNLQAAIGLEQLKKLPETDAKREKIRDKYNSSFGLENKSLYLYRINIDKRDDFIKSMQNDGIECGVHFKPLHLMKAFAKFAVGKSFPFAEENYRMTVSLPFYDTLTDGEVDMIIKKVRDWGGLYKHA